MLTSAVGLTLTGKIYKQRFDHGKDSQDVITPIEHLRHLMPAGFILILDHARFHIGDVTLGKSFYHPEIVVEPIAQYAPELNPEEYGHSNVKIHAANAAPAGRLQLRQLVDRGFARLRRRPDLMLSFIHATGLPVKQLWPS